MSLTLLMLIFSHTKMNVVMFIMAGVLSYFTDYRHLRDKPEYRREVMFIKTTSWIYVAGGVCVLFLFQIISWFV